MFSQINMNSHADLAYGLNSTFIGNLVRDNECQLELNTPGFQQMSSAYSSSSSSAGPTTSSPGATQNAPDADSLALMHAMIAYTEPTCYGLGAHSTALRTHSLVIIVTIVLRNYSTVH